MKSQASQTLIKLGLIGVVAVAVYLMVPSNGTRPSTGLAGETTDSLKRYAGALADEFRHCALAIGTGAIEDEQSLRDRLVEVSTTAREESFQPLYDEMDRFMKEHRSEDFKKYAVDALRELAKGADAVK